LVLARPRGSQPELEEPDPYLAEARGRSVKVARRPGVFSWEALDSATTLLLEGCLPRDGDHLLDLGCGAGVVAAIMLDEGKVATATLSDSDALALDASRETLALNGLRGELLASDAGDSLPEKSYDLILCNPPFHRGFRSERGALERMIARAARLLAPRGRLYIVGPHTLGLGGRLEAQFRRVDGLPATPSVELWRAGRPRRQITS
jgi:16S rRNA (guanine1207-N2)-methyltransferase